MLCVFRPAALVLLFIFFIGQEPCASMTTEIILPKAGFSPRQLAVVVNELEPQSVRIGKYYVEKRGIPQENLIKVRFSPSKNKMVMKRKVFDRVYAQVRDETPDTVQAYLLCLGLVSRVECMSITSAFALGFDEKYCAEGCKPTARSPYFNSTSPAPWDDFGFRPAMALPVEWELAKKVIDRGVASDETWPQGTGYLLETSDKARNVRSKQFAGIVKTFGKAYPLQVLKTDSLGALGGKADILFHFTGLARIPDLEKNTYLPGAVADSLTSGGGDIRIKRGPGGHTGVRQFLLAGATGSYGTVIEPCNFPQKFSMPGVVLAHYLAGETLIEAYWKSVAWPGQGIFVGDPLARPFGGARAKREGDTLVITTHSLKPGAYTLLASDNGLEPTAVLADNVLVRGYPQILRVPVDETPAFIVVRQAF